MSAAVDNRPEANKLCIGEGVTIKGAVLVSDTVVVNGVLEGDISVGNLIVSETGIVRGRISVVQNADISGKVFDRLDVKGLLILRSTSRVDGNLSCGILTIEQGASISGGVYSMDNGAGQQLPKFERKYEERKNEDRKHEARSGNPAPALKPLDLPTPELVPGPIAVTG
jgi:cytoskeletal protein CcmA (bactofilin family)